MQRANKTINTKVGLDLPMSEQVRQREVTLNEGNTLVPTSLLDTAFWKNFEIPRSETLINPVTNVTENNHIPRVLTFRPFNYKNWEIIRKF